MDKKKSGNTVGSFLILSIIFAFVAFLILKIFLEDVIGEYFGVALDQSIDVLSLANAWVFISTTILVLTTFLAVLFSGIEPVQASFSLFLSWFTTMLIVTLISYIGLLSTFPENFAGLDILQLLLGFNYYNMMFAVYVLGSFDTYYLVVAIIMFAQTFLYLSVTGSFKLKRVKRNAVNMVSVKTVF